MSVFWWLNSHDAVASPGFSARFQHTEKPKETVLYQNGLKAVENGGRGWIWTSDPCRVKTVLSPWATLIPSASIVTMFLHEDYKVLHL